MNYSLDLKNFFGSKLEPPPGITAYGEGAGGLILLFNNILKIAVFISLLFALINLLISAIQYIGSSGNPDLIKQASGRITNSLLGLVIAAASLVLAGLVGLLFFGNATAIINPVIYGP
ncbi:MAG: hypothetical protein NTZ93_04285 [Candidatus Beckwithbacteria bacterium]|nr:hypothetical protein [Candidatus Beckwithbacteria bacterium]